MRREAEVGFGRSADAYERGRPGYPQEAVALLAGALDLRAGRRVVDVGAGTGKLTRALVGTGAAVVAVEPVAQMRRRFAEALPGVEVRDGTAGALPLADGEVDAVVAGQAFHWFATHDTLAEFARVLRPDPSTGSWPDPSTGSWPGSGASAPGPGSGAPAPGPGGALGLIWNTRDRTVPWVARLGEIVDAHEGDSPRHEHDAWRDAFSDQPWFGELRRAAEVANVHRLALDDSLDRYASTSFVAALPDDERAAVLVRVAAVLAEAVGPDGTVAHPYRTMVWWAPLSGSGAGRSRP